MGPLRLRRRIFRPCTEATRLALRRRRLRARSAANRSLRVAFGAECVAGLRSVSTGVDLLDIASERGWRRVSGPDSTDALLAEAVWEHLDPEAGARTARKRFAFRRPGGYLRAAFPHGLQSDSVYRGRFRTGEAGPGAHDHRSPFDSRSFSAVSIACGLRTRLLEHFDQSGRFVCRPWSPDGGTVHRSIRYEERRAGGAPDCTSVVPDAITVRA